MPQVSAEASSSLGSTSGVEATLDTTSSSVSSSPETAASLRTCRSCRWSRLAGSTLVDGDDILVERCGGITRVPEGFDMPQRDAAPLVEESRPDHIAERLHIPSDNPAYPTRLGCNAREVIPPGRGRLVQYNAARSTQRRFVGYM